MCIQPLKPFINGWRYALEKLNERSKRSERALATIDERRACLDFQVRAAKRRDVIGCSLGTRTPNRGTSSPFTRPRPTAGSSPKLNIQRTLHRAGFAIAIGPVAEWQVLAHQGPKPQVGSRADFAVHSVTAGGVDCRRQSVANQLVFGNPTLSVKSQDKPF